MERRPLVATGERFISEPHETPNRPEEVEYDERTAHEHAVVELADIIGVDEENDSELYVALVSWLSPIPSAAATMGPAERELSDKLARAILAHGALDDLPLGPGATQRLRELTGLFRDARSNTSRIVPPRDTLARRIWSLQNNDHGLHARKGDELARLTYAAVHELSLYMTEQDSEDASVIRGVETSIEQTVEILPEAPKRVRRAMGKSATVKPVAQEDYFDDTDAPKTEDASDDEVPDTLKTVLFNIDSVKDYYAQIGKTPLLTAEQEVALSKAIEVGLFAQDVLEDRSGFSLGVYEHELHRLVAEGKEAKQHFIMANLRLVVSIARRHQGRGVLLLDMIQDGNMGLMHAIEKFDYTRGYKFSTYATAWIKQQITRAIADTAETIRIPVHVHETNTAIYRTKEFLEAQGLPTTDEHIIVAHGKLTPHDMEVSHRVSRQRPISYDLPLGDDTDGTLLDILGTDSSAPSLDEIVIDQATREAIRAMLDTLDERSAGVISMRYGLTDGRPMTLDEIGTVYGVTRERIRQIESKAMIKLRHPSRSQELRNYLDSW